ncbi:phenylalanine 4-monooxygenase [Granulosicoccus sp. 3-233]|uniref:phenylalanine 4-monooxygenase n=1 Tax=Granulosicoccus sp. 3-233 TaxID=3417969 RepID=UPI003D33765E
MKKTSQYVAKVPDASGHIDYSPEENAVWADLYAAQASQVRQYCANEYLQGLSKVGLSKDRVPSCADVSDTLHELTGWTVEPVPALIGFQRFFSMLANRTFPAASFIRDRKDFDYIEEPDIFHELFGHTPLLADQRFADFSECIGKAGMRARPEDYAWLIRLYWFTIEFGLTRESGQYKALGSGLASSPTELVYSVESGTPERRPFDIIDILRTPYRIDIHQPIYFVLEHADELFAAGERDLLADIQTARQLGLHAPAYPPIVKSA